MGRAQGKVRDQFTYVVGTRRGSDRPLEDQETQEPTDTVTATNDQGRTFAFRLVPDGGYHGRNRKVLNDSGEAMVEVYDTTYAGQEHCEPEGQIVSNYFLRTLLERPPGPGGISFHGGVPEWYLGAREMKEALQILSAMS